MLPVANGGEAWKITDLVRGAGGPSWSPDGKMIAFSSDTSAEDLAKQRKGAAKKGDDKSDKPEAGAAKPALAPLLDALKDNSGGVREAAALAVGRLDEPAEAVPALTKLIKDDKELAVRVAAARGLGQMGSAAKDAIPTLRDVWSTAKEAGRPQQRLTQATRDALDAIQGSRKKN